MDYKQPEYYQSMHAVVLHCKILKKYIAESVKSMVNTSMAPPGNAGERKAGSTKKKNNNNNNI